MQKIYLIFLIFPLFLSLSHAHTRTPLPLISQITLISLAKVSAWHVSSGRPDPKPLTMPRRLPCVWPCVTLNMRSISLLLLLRPIFHPCPPLVKPPTVPEEHGHRLQSQTPSPTLTSWLTLGSHLAILTQFLICEIR